jgi:hypothetical protein
MECCGQDRNSKFCPECGKTPEKKNIRKYLSEKLCDNPEYASIIFINKKDVGKQCETKRNYFDFKYGYDIFYPTTNRSDQECYCYLWIKPEKMKMREDLTIEYKTKTFLSRNISYSSGQEVNTKKYPATPDIEGIRNILLDDMKVLYYDPLPEITMEDVFIGFIKHNILNPQCIHIIGYSIRGRSTKIITNIERDIVSKYNEGIQKYYKDKLLFLESSNTLYLFNNKLYTFDELNQKYTEGIKNIKWDECITKTHKINKLIIHELDNDLNILFNKIAEKNQTSKV